MYVKDQYSLDYIMRDPVGMLTRVTHTGIHCSESICNCSQMLAIDLLHLLDDQNFFFVYYTIFGAN